MKKKGFTLIELLVVIAIIAILAGMLLPSLGSAKEAAKKIACSAKMRSLGTFWQFYTDNSDGYLLPRFAKPVPGGPSDDHKGYFTELMILCPEAQMPCNMSFSELNSKIGGGDHKERDEKSRMLFGQYFMCPSQPDLNPRTGSWWSASWVHMPVGYGYNYEISRADGEKNNWQSVGISKISQLRNCSASSAPLLSEWWKTAASVDTSSFNALGNRCMPPEGGHGSEGDEQYQPWYSTNRAHVKSSNMLWMDGHVESLSARPAGYKTAPWK